MSNIGSINRIVGGTLNTIVDTVTVVGVTSVGNPPSTNPITIAGTDSGGTLHIPLVDNTGALKVSGASAGTNVNIVTGTQQTLGTVSVLNSGSVVVTNGTVIVGSITNLATLGTVQNINGGSIVVTTGTVGNINQIGTVTVVNAGSVVVTLGTVLVTNGTIVQASGTLTTGSLSNVATLGTLIRGTIVGPDATAGTSNSNPVQIGGTSPTGTVYGLLTDTSGRLHTSQETGTLSTGTLQNLVSGSITVTGGTTNITTGSIVQTAGTLTTGTLQNLVSGTINAGSVVVNSGTITTGSIAVTLGTIARGTVVGADATAGTSNSQPVQIGGTTATGTVYGMSVDTSGKPQINVVSGTLNTGSVVVNSGTIGVSSGSLVVTVGTVNVTTGTVVQASGTLTTGSLTNLASVGTISNLAGGSIVQTAGTTIVTTGSIVQTAGTVTTGSIVQTAGTVTTMLAGTLTALANGTITTGTINKEGYRGITQSTTFGTLGTAGGSFFGTISGTSGAGTIHMISGLSIVCQSGTPDVRILIGSAITGGSVLAGGAFVPSGGIARDFNPPIESGTNSELIYHFVNAGTAFITVQYWKTVV